jgi:hypothetical protein
LLQNLAQTPRQGHYKRKFDYRVAQDKERASTSPPFRRFADADGEDRPGHHSTREADNKSSSENKEETGGH